METEAIQDLRAENTTTRPEIVQKKWPLQESCANGRRECRDSAVSSLHNEMQDRGGAGRAVPTRLIFM